MEQHPERVAQIRANKERFDVGNLQVVQARLPEGIDDLPAPDPIPVSSQDASTPEWQR